MRLKPPLPVTLRKYGLSTEAWMAIARRQGGVCFVCQQLPSSGRLCVDHEHVRGWKKLPPEERAKCVRGLLCFWCNSRFVGRAISVERSRRVTQYLEAHGLRSQD